MGIDESSKTAKKLPEYGPFPERVCNNEENPFEYDSPITKWEAFKLFFFIFSGLLFLRLILFALLMCYGFITAKIAAIGLDVDRTHLKPLSPLRRALIRPLRGATRYRKFGCSRSFT